MNEGMSYRTSIGDAPDRAGGDDDHTRLGLYQLFAKQMRQVMLGCRKGQHLLPDLRQARSRSWVEALTEMVNDVCLAPLGAMQAGAACTLCHASIEQKVVQPVPPELLKRLLCKRLDRLEI